LVLQINKKYIIYIMMLVKIDHLMDVSHFLTHF